MSNPTDPDPEWLPVSSEPTTPARLAKLKQALDTWRGYIGGAPTRWGSALRAGVALVIAEGSAIGFWKGIAWLLRKGASMPDLIPFWWTYVAAAVGVPLGAAFMWFVAWCRETTQVEDHADTLRLLSAVSEDEETRKRRAWTLSNSFAVVPVRASVAADGDVFIVMLLINRSERTWEIGCVQLDWIHVGLSQMASDVHQSPVVRFDAPFPPGTTAKMSFRARLVRSPGEVGDEVKLQVGPTSTRVDVEVGRVFLRDRSDSALLRDVGGRVLCETFLCKITHIAQ